MKKPAVHIVAIVTAFALVSCKTKLSGRNRLDENRFPRAVLWAWERPEDFNELNPAQFAVAFLAQTLALKGDDVISHPRHQPLQVPATVKVMAVTRIESQKTTGGPAKLSDSQRQKVTALILKTLDFPNVKAIQIDFDAAASERNFYRSILQELRQRLPDNVPLSITALASFCVGDRWLKDLSVDEAVPMIFRMGADDRSIKTFLAGGNDFRDPVCRQSYGIALKEPLNMEFDHSRRTYVFNDHPWKQSDIAAAGERISP
jgi:hypothetical protein